ncbi:MAG: hypothetical protein EBS06_09180 [Proteobacteria bacterium]|nr:hypothetical protein [Pseudomonadota bacterium]
MKKNLFFLTLIISLYCRSANAVMGEEYVVRATCMEELNYFSIEGMDIESNNDILGFPGDSKKNPEGLKLREKYGLIAKSDSTIYQCKLQDVLLKYQIIERVPHGKKYEFKFAPPIYEFTGVGLKVWVNDKLNVDLKNFYNYGGTYRVSINKFSYKYFNNGNGWVLPYLDFYGEVDTKSGKGNKKYSFWQSYNYRVEDKEEERKTLPITDSKFDYLLTRYEE